MTLAEWRARAPRLAGEVAAGWGVRLGEPGWTVAHTVAWSGVHEPDDPHLEAAGWLLGEA